MKNLKRIGSLLLVLVMLFSLVGCGMSAEEIADTADLIGSLLEEAETAETEEAPESDATETEENTEEPETVPEEMLESEAELPDPDGYYYDLENVVLYLYVYGELPANYITKDEAEDLGWQGGSVQRYLEGAAIGGDHFGNREGLLPKADGRTYTECDLYTDGEDERGAYRLVFSNDGLYFYTENHYKSFTEVYVTEEYTVEWK